MDGGEREAWSISVLVAVSHLHGTKACMGTCDTEGLASLLLVYFTPADQSLPVLRPEHTEHRRQLPSGLAEWCLI